MATTTALLAIRRVGVHQSLHASNLHIKAHLIGVSPLFGNVWIVQELPSLRAMEQSDDALLVLPDEGDEETDWTNFCVHILRTCE
jgi:hypothetical protein